MSVSKDDLVKFLEKNGRLVAPAAYTFEELVIACQEVHTRNFAKFLEVGGDFLESRENPTSGPKVHIELTIPDHQEELDNFLHGGALKSILFQLDQSLRSCVRHGADFNGLSLHTKSKKSLNHGMVDLCEHIRSWIREECTSRGINLDN
jgi:hypothetical protein